MKRAFLLVGLVLSGCTFVLEVADATIEGRPAICHRFQGDRHWKCDLKDATPMKGQQQ